MRPPHNFTLAPYTYDPVGNKRSGAMWLSGGFEYVKRNEVQGCLYLRCKYGKNGCKAMAKIHVASGKMFVNGAKAHCCHAQLAEEALKKL